MTNTNEPRIDRVGLETKFRSLQVERVERVTPRMLRVTLIGAELAGFASLAFDDHVKIAVPTPSGEMVRRDYTPRRFGDRALVLDFALHDAGPATHWALNARPGDTLVVGGPRGSAVLVGDVRRFLLIGDETALPAIGRFIEEAKPDAQIASVVAVAGRRRSRGSRRPRSSRRAGRIDRCRRRTTRTRSSTAAKVCASHLEGIEAQLNEGESMTTIVVAKSPGGPDVLELAEVPTPSPGPNQVRIDVRAIGVNPIDHKLLAGGRGAPFPFRPGLEVSGVVAELGPGVTSFRVGDAVLAFGVSGGYASELVVAAEDVFHKPANVSFEEAAGLLLVGTTAVHALEKVRLTSGETVLAHGASGSVGQVLVQLAKARGARIIGTSSAKNFDLIRSLGAEPLAYGPGLVERVQALAPKVDAAVDLIGTDEAIDVSLALVADRQRITTIVGGAYPDAKGIQKIGGGPGADPGTELRKAARTELVELAGTGALKIRVTRTFPLQQAREALQFVKDGHAAGKVVLIP